MSEAGKVIVRIVANDQELRTALQQSGQDLQSFATKGGAAGQQLGQEVAAGVAQLKPGTAEAIAQIEKLGQTIIHVTKPVDWSGGVNVGGLVPKVQAVKQEIEAVAPASAQAAAGIGQLAGAAESIPEGGIEGLDDTVEILQGMKAELDATAISVGYMGEQGQAFKRLQTAVDSALNLINSDLTQTGQRSESFSTQVRASLNQVEAELVNLAAASRRMEGAAAVSFSSLQENINRSLGIVDRPLISAAQSMSAFQNSFLGSTPVIDGVVRDMGQRVPGAASQFTASLKQSAAAWGALLGSFLPGVGLQIPNQLAGITHQFSGINMYMVAGVGAAFALAGAIAYVAASADEAADNASRIKLGAEISGNFGVTEEIVSGLIDKLNELSFTSKEDLTATANEFKGLRNVGVDSFVGLTTAATLWASANGAKAEEVGKKFTAIIDGQNTSMEELEGAFGKVTEAQYQQIRAAQMTGDRQQITNAVLEITTQRLQENEEGALRTASSTQWYERAAASAIGVVDLFSARLDHNRSVWQLLVKDIWAVIGAQGVYIDKSYEAMRAARMVAEGITDPAERMEELANKRATLMKGMAEAQKNMRGGELVAYLNETLGAIAQVDKEIKTATEAMGREAFNEFALQEDLKASKAKDASAAAIEAARNKVAELKRLGLEETADYTRAVIQLNTLERSRDQAAAKAALKDEAKAAKDATKELRELNEAKRDGLQTDLQIAQVQMGLEMDIMSMEVSERRATNEQRIQLAIDHARRMGQLRLEMLENEKKTYKEGTAEFARAENEKRLAKAETAAEIERLNRELALSERRTARESGSVWASATSAIVSAEQSMMGDLLSGRVTFLEAGRRALVSFLQQELIDTAIYFTKKALMSETDFALEERQMAKGVLVHALTETSKTSSSVIGAAARSTVTIAETTTDVTRAGIQAGAHAAMEGTKTAATVAGAAARMAAELSAGAAGMAQSVAMGQAQIMNDAYKAAAGAYAAVVDIPVIGPILAPIAATVAFGAVSAFNMLSGGFEKGGFTGGRAGQPAGVVHGEEFVVNASATAQARPLLEALNAGVPLSRLGAFGIRDMRATGSINNTSTNSGNMQANLTYAPNISGAPAKGLDELLASQPKTLIKWFENAVRNGALKLSPRMP